MSVASVDALQSSVPLRATVRSQVPPTQPTLDRALRGQFRRPSTTVAPHRAVARLLFRLVEPLSAAACSCAATSRSVSKKMPRSLAPPRWMRGERRLVPSRIPLDIRPTGLVGNVSCRTYQRTTLHRSSTLPQTCAGPVNAALRPNGTFGDLCTARELVNVVITGEGTIDGNGRNPGKRGGYGRPHSNNRPLLVTPSFIDGLTIHGGLTITDGANWQTHPMFCNHVWISNLTVASVGVPNGDGIDPDSCSDVLIEDCDLATVTIA